MQAREAHGCGQMPLRIGAGTGANPPDGGGALGGMPYNVTQSFMQRMLKAGRRRWGEIGQLGTACLYYLASWLVFIF